MCETLGSLTWPHASFLFVLGGAGTESKLGGSKLWPEDQTSPLPSFEKRISLERSHPPLTAHGCL